MEYSNSLWINTDCKYNDINLSVNILVPNCCYVFIESINIFVTVLLENRFYIKINTKVDVQKIWFKLIYLYSNLSVRWNKTKTRQ